MKELGTIEQEAAACRKAFKGVKVGAPVRCCHHDTLVEVLTEPPKNRIYYILTAKDFGEQARRLHEFRPIPKRMYADYEAKRKPLYDDYEAKRKPLDDDYEAKRKLLDDDYEAKRKPLDDDYKAKCKLLDDRLQAKCKLLDADYKAKRKPLDKPIADLVPDTTWNGKSIL